MPRKSANLDVLVYSDPAVMVARVREELLAAGTAKLTDVDRRVALIATPVDRKTGPDSKPK